MVALGDTLDGKYRLDQQIGRGGFARVYLGHDLALDRAVAVKVLNPELAEDDPTFLDRFTTEARDVARLDHHNIVPVYVHGTVDGTVYLVMPYIAGGSLRNTLTGVGRLSLHEASAFLGQAAAALDYAHGRNIAHRDVKPENMLVRDDGRLLLADFGIAKVVEETQMATTHRVQGTPYYMAPEAWQGKAGRPADVYALGCVLFEMLTGTRPYNGSMTQLWHGHSEQPVPSLAERIGQPVPAALQTIVERAMAKQPGDRYASAGALAGAVQAVAEGRAPAEEMTIPVPVPPSGPRPFQAATTPVSAPPPPAPRRSASRVGLAAAVTLALLLCMVGLVAARGRGEAPTPTSTIASVAGASTPVPTPVVDSPTPAAAIIAPTATVVIVLTTAPTATLMPTATPRPQPTATGPVAQAAFFGGQRYRDGRGRFAFVVPTSWTQVEPAGAEVAFQSSVPSGQVPATVNIVLEQLPSAAVTLEQYDAAGEANLRQQFADYRAIEVKPVTVDGRRGLQRIYVVTIVGRVLQLQQVNFVENGVAYVLTCGALQGDFQYNATTFDQITASFAVPAR